MNDGDAADGGAADGGAADGGAADVAAQTEELTATVSRLEDALLGGPRTLTLTQVAERAGADVDEVRLFWHALGMPSADDEAVVFTERDAQLVTDVLRSSRAYDLPHRTGVSLVRSIGHTTDRLVLWQAEALVEHMAERYALDDAGARARLLHRLPDLVPLLEEQLVHAFRRQLAALAVRWCGELTGGAPAAGSGELPLARAVGFADIVAFTTRTADLGPHGLAELVERFESRARDVVTAQGGRVVKTIGDAVLFVADDPLTGARLALALAEAFGPGSPTPVRVGLVWGRVLSRFGDLFGPPVILASRLTQEADPGAVLLDEATAHLLEPMAVAGGLTLHTEAGREVQGLGLMRPVRLGRAA